MNVFLVPVGPQDHELYCEVSSDAAVGEDVRAEGFFSSLKHRFREMLAAAERDREARLNGVAVDEPAGWWARLKGRTLRWAAESIAEQRLLWHLRRCREAELGYPSDLAEERARESLRAQLTRDYDKHRRWFIIDALGFIASGVFMLVPGPNIIAYYFAFRFVGHYLSMRGARQGLDGTAWRFHAREELMEIRALLGPDAPARSARLRAIESRLRLNHLASFVERVAAS